LSGHPLLLRAGGLPLKNPVGYALAAAIFSRTISLMISAWWTFPRQVDKKISGKYKVRRGKDE
jgi:hypothetical protein